MNRMIQTAALILKENAIVFCVLTGLWLLLQVLILIVTRRQPRPLFSWHQVGTLAFVLAAAVMLKITGVPTLRQIVPDVDMNLIPFLDVFSDYLQYLANVFLFIPIGFLYPLLWEKKKPFLRTCLFGCCFSLSIELSQLLSRGSITDINDIMTNTAGALLGYGLFSLFKRIIPKGVPFFRLSAAPNHIITKHESLILLVLAWAAVFFI